MEKTANKTNDPILVRIANQLLRDQQELDELAVQFALGKAEAGDRFEALKENMKDAIRDFRQRVRTDTRHGVEATEQLMNHLDQLEESLADGIAENMDKFREQKNRILGKLDDVAKSIELEKGLQKTAELYNATVEKARLQMTLFEKKFSEKSIELGNEFREEMKQAREKIDLLVQKTTDAREDLGERFEHFNDELHIAYDHLKKAFKAL